MLLLSGRVRTRSKILALYRRQDWYEVTRTLLGGDFAWKERMFCWVKFGVCRGVCLPCSLILIKGFLALVTEVRRGLNLLSNLRFGWILVNLLLFEYSE